MELTHPTIKNSRLLHRNRKGIFVAGQGSLILGNHVIADRRSHGISVTKEAIEGIRENLIRETGFSLGIEKLSSVNMELDSHL